MSLSVCRQLFLSPQNNTIQFDTFLGVCVVVHHARPPRLLLGNTHTLPPSRRLSTLIHENRILPKTPAAYTMISDLFPASVRGTANSIYSSGVYLGGALASLSLLLNGEDITCFEGRVSRAQPTPSLSQLFLLSGLSHASEPSSLLFRLPP